MGFPGHTFPLSNDPVFDALDFGVAGRILARGGAFALQNSEGLGLDLEPEGPLTRVSRGYVDNAATTPAPWRRRTRTAMVPARAQKKRVRQGAESSDHDGQFGDDEKEGQESNEHLSAHLSEGGRGNLACSVQDTAGRILIVHAGGRELEHIKVSHLKQSRGGRSWQMTRLLSGVQGNDAADASGMKCDGEPGPSGTVGSSSRQLVQLTSSMCGDATELAWIGARSRADVTVYRLRNQPSAAASASVSLSCVGKICASHGTATSSIVLNPHWGGEAALLDTSGNVDLWTAGSETVVSLGGPGSDLRAQAALSHAPPYVEALSTLRRLALDFGQLAWGAHPRTLLCAQAYRLSLIDFRSPASCHSELLSMPSAALAQAGRFYSIASGAAVGSPHEFAAVTSSLVCVFDIRQPSLPMLRWLHHQEYDPPRHLSMYSIPVGCRGLGGDVGMARACGSDARLLATGNERWGEVILYQYGAAAEDAALMSLEQPRKLLSLGDTNKWPGDGHVLHAPDNFDRAGIDPISASSQEHTRSSVRRLAGLALALNPPSHVPRWRGVKDAAGEECEEGEEGGDTEEETGESGDGARDESKREGRGLVGVVVQMSHTGEVFAHGMRSKHEGAQEGRLDRHRDESEARVWPQVRELEVCYGSQAFRGWVDGDRVLEDEGEACNGSGFDSESGGVDRALDALAASAGRLSMDGVELGRAASLARAVSDSDGDDAVPAARPAARRRKGAGRARVSGQVHGRQEQERASEAGKRKSIGMLAPAELVSATGRRLGTSKGGVNCRDLCRVFEFAAGLRGFDGKVSEGVRLPEPGARRPLERCRRLCEICGFRMLYKRVIQPGVRLGQGSGNQWRGHNKMHVCANCNSAWHSKCIAKLYVTRREVSLKKSRKVPHTRVPFWVCPQCTFYAEERARLQQYSHLTRAQLRLKLRDKKVPIPINRDEPAGGAWGTADALVHDVDKAFQGLGVADISGSASGGGYMPIGESSWSRAAAKSGASSSSVGFGVGSGHKSHEGGASGDAGGAGLHDSSGGLVEVLGPQLERFVAWPPKTMLEILVHVRRDLGMASVSLAELGACLVEMTGQQSSSWKEPPIIVMEGHEAATEAAAALLAEMPDSESVESVSFGSLSMFRAGDSEDDPDADSEVETGGGRQESDARVARLQAARAKKNAVLLRQLCCCVFAARVDLEQVVEKAVVAGKGSGARDFKPKKRGGNLDSIKRGVRALSDEQIREIFSQRPVDQYLDVPGDNGTMTTRLVFDQYNRRLPSMRRRSGGPSRRPDGKFSLMQMLAKKYHVRTSAISDIWLRRYCKAVTNSLKGAMVHQPTNAQGARSGACGADARAEEEAASSIGSSARNRREAAEGGQDGKEFGARDRAGAGEAVGVVDRQRGEIDFGLSGVGALTPIARGIGRDEEEDGAGGMIDADLSVEFGTSKDSPVSAATVAASGPSADPPQDGPEGVKHMSWLGDEMQVGSLLQRLRKEWTNATVAAGVVVPCSSADVSRHEGRYGADASCMSAASGGSHRRQHASGAEARWPAGILKSPDLSPRKTAGKRVSMSGVLTELSGGVSFADSPRFSLGGEDRVAGSGSFHTPRSQRSGHRYSVGASSSRLGGGGHVPSAKGGGPASVVVTQQDRVSSSTPRALPRSRTSMLLGSGGSGAFDTMRRAPSKTTPLSAGASFASHRTPAPSGGFSGQAGSAVSVRGEVGVSGGAAAAGRRVSGDGRSPDRHGPVNRGGSGKGGLEKQVQAARVAARRRGSMGSGGGF